MKIEKDYKEKFRYSMHDARIFKIEHLNNNLILYFDNLFYYENDETKYTNEAKIIFEKVDMDYVDFLVFDDVVEDKFSGSCIKLSDYQDRYKYNEFEVIVETHNSFRAVLQGWLWIGDKPRTCIINIFYLGKMIYEIK